MKRFTDMTRRLVEAPAFEYTIIAIIVLNGALLGMTTSAALSERYESWFSLGPR